MKKKSAIFNLCNVYMFLWCIYTLHWTNLALPIIEPISNVILGLALCISIIFTVRALRTPHIPSLFKYTNWLILFFLGYGMIYITVGPEYFLFGSPVKKGTYLVSFLRSFLPIYTFYYFTLRGWLTLGTARFWAIVFLLEFIGIYFHSLFLHSLISSGNEFTNNIGYLFCIIAPCVFLFRKRMIVQLLFLSVCLFFVVMSLKRGALLILLCVIVMYVKITFKDWRGIKKLYFGLAILLGIFIGAHFLINRFYESERFRQRIEDTLEGNTSHRDVLVKEFLDYYETKANFSQQVFGSGADSTLGISDNWAHNDWIEILICQGFVGALVYLAFWVGFYKQWRSTNDLISKNLLGAIFIVYFLRTFFSMSYSMILPIASMALGFALAREQMRKYPTLICR